MTTPHHTAAMREDEEREAFEKWAQDEGYSVQRVGTDSYQ